MYGQEIGCRCSVNVSVCVQGVCVYGCATCTCMGAGMRVYEIKQACVKGRVGWCVVVGAREECYVYGGWGKREPWSYV
jgi:hypothetical protein